MCVGGVTKSGRGNEGERGKINAFIHSSIYPYVCSSSLFLRFFSTKAAAMNLNGAECRSGPCQMQTRRSAVGLSSSILQSPFVLLSKKNNHSPSKDPPPFFFWKPLRKTDQEKNICKRKKKVFK